MDNDMSPNTTQFSRIFPTQNTVIEPVDKKNEKDKIIAQTHPTY